MLSIMSPDLKWFPCIFHQATGNMSFFYDMQIYADWSLDKIPIYIGKY